MKKLFFAVLAVLCIVFSSSVVYHKYVNGESVLKGNIAVYGIPAERRFIPFRDKVTNKIGFLRNNSDLNVAQEPYYDDIYNDVYLLVAIKKDGKWGVVDLGGRFYIPKGAREGIVTPLIPCSYNKVEVLSNRKVKCDGYTIDVYDDLKYKTYDSIFGD